jgi:hypothetical protein
VGDVQEVAIGPKVGFAGHVAVAQDQIPPLPQVHVSAP